MIETAIQYKPSYTQRLEMNLVQVWSGLLEFIKDRGKGLYAARFILSPNHNIFRELNHSQPDWDLRGKYLNHKTADPVWAKERAIGTVNYEPT